MSSLRDQLAQIASNNAALVFDRKKRQKLHSASLIYNSKTAATQDYDFIFENAAAALQELIEIDPRFEVFTNTLFSPTSIGIDRNVQSKEENDNLDNAITSYLMLVAPRWNLTPALYATEWLVRRFQIHIQNAETLLLSALHHYKSSAFKRILSIIKLPPLFNPLSNFTRNEKSPANLTIVKLFSDMDFLKVYTNFLSKCLEHRTAQHDQLAFATCCYINLLAFNSNNSATLNELAPILLDISSKLLKSSSSDAVICGHTILVVISTTIPLMKQIVNAAVETVLSNLAEERTKKSGLLCLLKLYQSLKGEDNTDPMPELIHKLIDRRFSNEYILDTIARESFVAYDVFITSYIRAALKYNHSKFLSNPDLLLKTELTRFQLRTIISDLLSLSKDLEDKSILVTTFEALVTRDEALVLDCLKHAGVPPDILEIRLMTSLFAKENESVDVDVNKELEKASEKEEDTKVPAFQEFLEKNSRYMHTSGLSMLVEPDASFNKYLTLFTECLNRNYDSDEFLTSFFTTLESRVTFLLRSCISPIAPVVLRLVALSFLSKYLNNIDRESNLFTLVPCLICALNDPSRRVRLAAKNVLTQISERPATKHYFLLPKIYGENVTLQMLAPDDGQFWLKGLLGDYMVENRDFSSMFVPKRNVEVYLLFWADQALKVPIPQVKIVLFDILGRYSDTPDSYSSVFKEFIGSYMDQRQVWEARCRDNKVSFKEFEKRICGLISDNETHKFIIDFIITTLNSSCEQLAELVVSRLIRVFGTMKSSFQLQIFRNMVESSAQVEHSYDLVSTLQSLPLNAELFNSIISENKFSSDSSIPPLPKRRRRRSSIGSILQNEEVSHFAEDYLRKLNIILETLDKSKIPGTPALLSTLLSLLSDLETLDQEGGLPVLYAQETLASCLLNAIDTLKETDAGEMKNIRADIVVSAIRNSTSPQLQNKLILVVSSLAKLNPETVLHSVMPIFTFMGAQTIRQDDEFTAQVVEKTITSIVPAFFSNKGEDLGDETELLLMSFTAALLHVPRHRRVRLYSILVKTLGASTSIGPFFFLISQLYSSSKVHFKVPDSRAIVEFSKNFLASFNAFEQLTAFADCLMLLHDLSVSLNDTHQRMQLQSRPIFTNGVLNMTESELVILVQNCFEFINKLIRENDSEVYSSENSFRVSVYSTLIDEQNGEEYTANIKAVFSRILKYLLLFINNLHELFKASESSEGAVREELKNQDDHINDTKETLFSLLNNVLTVLPIGDFSTSVLSLLDTESEEDIKYHLVLVIGTKFEKEPSDASIVAATVSKKLLGLLSENKTSTSICQILLNTLSTLVNKFGANFDPSSVVEILSAATEILLSKKIDVIISALSVITASIQILGVKMISFYPKIFPQSVKLFNSTRENETMPLRSHLQLAVLLLFATLVKTIPTFVVSNLGDVLRVVFFADDVDVSTRLSVVELIVSHMDHKELLRVLQQCWLDDVSTSNDSIAISLYLGTLEGTVEAVSKRDATVHSPVFFKLLLSLFEFRSTSSFDNNTISRIEASVYDIANTYILKMNDRVFRPLFVIMIKWAFDGEGVTNSKITEVERLVAFFKFFNKLQENLKGIITTYFTYLLEPTVEVLKKFISKDMNNVNLQRLVLNSLTSSFRYDSEGYWKSSARFEVVCEPLVGQLKVIESVIGKYLVKALSSLASNNVGTEEHSQMMAKLLITHMKATCSPSEKLWTIRAVKIIYSKVGENWLSLLPQFVPVIAELLEDEDENVEHEVRSGLVKVVEKVLGEPFDRYLN